MIKNILVPTDFSKCAMNAAKVAATIAKKLNAKLHFIHVIEVPVVTYDVGMVNFESLPQAMFMKDIANKNMTQLLGEDFLSGLAVSWSLEYDAIYKRINQRVEKEKIDLIVMGSHGASGINELILGSNAEKVTRYATCPVLTIKKEHDNFDIKNIVLASNFYRESKIVFKGFKEFMNLFNAKLHLVKVITPSNFESTPRSKKVMSDFVEAHHLENHTLNIYNYENEEDGIMTFSDEINADMIVIGTHGRTGISHLFKGSIAEDVLNHATRPVLSIKIDIPETENDVLFPEV